MPYSGIVGLELQKAVVVFEIRTLKFEKLQNFMKKKIAKFGIKNALFRFFWGWSLKNYSHIWNQNYQICQIPEFHEISKMPNFWTTNALFEYFWARIFKSYCDISNEHL